MLCFKHVRFDFGRRRVIDDVSLSIGAGAVAVVLGPNGAGKSTLLDICLGWRTPRSGSVEIDSKDLRDMSGRERSRIVSLVPQRENIRFDFPVEDYVLLGRAPHLPPLGMPGDRDREIALDALETVGIADLRQRSVVTLSGGEYQLMLIARSLAQQPRLLLLDEPTSQLDPAHRIDILRILKRLSKKGITILLTSHSPEIASLIADEVFLLAEGKVLGHGPPRSMLTEENLESMYGIPFHVRWLDGQPHFAWDL